MAGFIRPAFDARLQQDVEDPLKRVTTNTKNTEEDVQLPFNVDPSWTLLLGIALLVWILMRRAMRRSRKSRKKTRLFAAPTKESTREPLADAPPETLRWQVEMHETARELKGELDSKISIVQTLIKMARNESQRLEENIEHARRLGLPARRDTLEEIERLADKLTDSR